MAANKKINKLENSLNTTDATVTTILTVTIPSGHSIAGKVVVVSRNTSTGATKDFQSGIVAKNVSGTVTTGSSFSNLLADEATSVSITNSGNDMLIRVTGIAATNIDWFAEIEYIEN